MDEIIAIALGCTVIVIGQSAHFLLLKWLEKKGE